MSGMAAPPDVDLTSTGSGYPHYSKRPDITPPREPASLPDAIERIRAERDILRRRVEERAHDCANVEAERDRLREENERLKQMLASASQADLTPGVPFSAPGVPSSDPMADGFFRGLTKGESDAYKVVLEQSFGGTDE